MNFALYSANSTSAELCFFTEQDLRGGRVSHSIQLDPTLNRTGDVWHIQIPGVATDLLYGGRPLLLLTPACEKLMRMRQLANKISPLCRLQTGRTAPGFRQKGSRPSIQPSESRHIFYHLDLAYSC